MIGWRVAGRGIEVLGKELQVGKLPDRGRTEARLVPIDNQNRSGCKVLVPSLSLLTLFWFFLGCCRGRAHFGNYSLAFNGLFFPEQAERTRSKMCDLLHVLLRASSTDGMDAGVGLHAFPLSWVRVKVP